MIDRRIETILLCVLVPYAAVAVSLGVAVFCGWWLPVELARKVLR